MKFLIISFILFFGLNSPFPVLASQGNENSTETVLENIDAVQAIAIANQWRWTKKEIKSYVNSREVVFKFTDGRVKKVPLPKDKMIIAVAPYIKRTHK